MQYTTQQLKEAVQNLFFVKAIDRVPENEGDLQFIKFGIKHQYATAAFYEEGLWFDADGNGLFEKPVNIVWLDHNHPAITALLQLLDSREENANNEHRMHTFKR